MPKFRIVNQKTGNEKTLDVDKETISLGRSAGNDLPIDSPLVSRRHAEIVQIKGDFFLVDLESGNGTFLNDKKLKPHDKNLLRTNDVIRIEEFNIYPIIATDPAGSEENTDSGIIEIKMIKKVLTAFDREKDPSLELLDASQELKKVFFSEDMEELNIGREKDCQLFIDDPVISRRHAVLHKKWGGVTVEDLKSKNGTYVNSKKIGEQLLKEGDIITFGHVKALFKNPREIDLATISRDYEKKEPKVEPKPTAQATAPSTPQVSEEARLSIDPTKKAPVGLKETKKPPPETSKTAPPQFFKAPSKQVTQTVVKAKIQLSRMEQILIGAGLVLLIAALLALAWLAHASDWRTLSPGLSYTKLTIPSPDESPAATIHAIRVNPKKFRLRPVVNGSGSLSSVRQLAETTGALAAINANFFDEAGQPLGLVVQDGKVLSPLKKISWWSLFAMNEEAPQIVHSADFVTAPSITSAIQAGPRLVISGAIPRLKQDSSARTAIGINARDEVLLVATQKPISMEDLARLMSRSEDKGGLGCLNALNLDGGSSTQMFIKVDSFELVLPSYVGIPVALGVFER